MKISKITNANNLSLLNNYQNSKNSKYSETIQNSQNLKNSKTNGVGKSNEKKIIFCLVGPSASGKSTLIKENMEKLNFGEIVSTTTRAPRIGEKNGIDYNFVSKNDFEKLDMLEKDEYAGDFYGTSLQAVFNSLEDKNGTMTAITFEGAQNIKRYIREHKLENLDVVSIFIATPKIELKQRMIDRGDSEKSIQKRLDNIIKRKEYDNMFKTDYIFIPDNLSKYRTNSNFCNLLEFHDYGQQFFENCDFAIENTKQMNRFVYKTKPFLEMFPYWRATLHSLYGERNVNVTELAYSLKLEVPAIIEILLAMENAGLCYCFSNKDASNFYKVNFACLTEKGTVLVKSNYVDTFEKEDANKEPQLDFSSLLNRELEL